MPDDITTIYKLGLDSSDYIRGVDSAASSLTGLNEVMEKAKKILAANEAALKSNTDWLSRSRKDLEAYTGTNERYRKQLEKSVREGEAEQTRLTKIVDANRLAYEKAAKAAQDFAEVSARASQLQQGTTGGKIPTNPPVGPPPPIIQHIKTIVDSTELEQLPEILAQTEEEFNQLRAAIVLAEDAMKSMDVNSDEFRQLGEFVQKGKIALEAFDNATKKTEGSQGSLRSQLRLAREELVRLEQAGKGASKEYLDLELRTAKLTDAFADQQARIKVLASDTRLLDFGKASITAATSAFQVYSSVQILVGGNSEELQKKTMQLFAAMQLLTSLQQLQTIVQRGNIIATGLQTAATAAYTAVVGAATGALKVFRIALLATGAGAAILAIGFLIKKFIDLRDAQKKAAEEQRLFNTVRTQAIEGYSKEVSALEILRINLTNLNLPQSQRIELAKEYNKTADEGNKIDVKQIENINLLNAAIDRQIVKIRARALEQASANVTAEAANKLFLAEQKLSEVNAGFVLNLSQIDQQIEAVKADFDSAAVSFALSGKKADQQLSITLGKTLRALQDIKKANDEFNRSVNLAASLTLPQTVSSSVKKQMEAQIKALDDEIAAAIDIKLIPSLVARRKKLQEEYEKLFNPKTVKTGTVDNVFDEERAKQKERLAELNRKSLEDAKAIRAQFDEQLKREKLRIDNLLKDKKVTPLQAKELKVEAGKINTVELEKALEDFTKKVADAREKLNDELRDLQNKNTQNTLNLIQDEFNKRAALIEFNEKVELENAKEDTEDRLKALELQKETIIAAGATRLEGEAEFQRAKNIIITNGEQAALNIIQQKAQERQKLAADLFQNLLKAYDDAIFQSDLLRDKQLVKDLQIQLELYRAGKISFSEFQKAITQIQKDEAEIRSAADLATQKNKLAALDDELKKIEDKYSEHYKNLKKQRDDLDADITQKEKAKVVSTETPGREDVFGSVQTEEAAKRIAQIDFIQAKAQDLTNSVISFWQTANKAEAEALDRSIALQEKRVDAAQRIAERGNAQYLKAEEDRLKELQVKRENAARRQLAIDAALQASQVLIGITGAIAKIATPGIGIAEMITSIVAIVGALATGYALVKSLQGNQPTFFKGTPELKRGKHPQGRDTIPAWLDEGEAIIPTKTNKNYKKAVEAIYYEKVPAQVMNEFVHNYVTNKNVYDTTNENINNIVRDHYTLKGVPQPHFERIKGAAESKVQHDGKLTKMIGEQNKLLEENNQLQRQTLRAMSKMSISANIDRDGVAIMVNEHIEQLARDRKA